jgi:hypothetical protein
MSGADMRECSRGFVTLGVMVMNHGSRGVEPGVNVAFYQDMGDGSRDLLGVTQTLGFLLPGMSEYVELEWEIPEDQRGAESYIFVVVVDDSAIGEVAIHECDEDNNESLPIDAFCDFIT